MEAETFKIIDIDTALKMMEEMNNELTLKIVGGYVWWLKLTNKKEYQVLDTKIARRRYAFDTYYKVTNDEGRDVWVSAEYIELVY